MSRTDGNLLDLKDWSLVRDTPRGQVTLLDRIDLKLAPGEWVGILGANGSGKTSLLRFLASDESPLGGRTGLIFQDPDEQIVAATVTDELALGRPGLEIDRWLLEFGLAQVAELNPRLLSAGQKQKLSVAIALAGRPDLLLCDEPTSLQDRHQAAWLLEHLQRWRRRTGGGVLWATQAEAEARLADRLILIAGGRIEADGDPAELLALPAVQSLLRPPIGPPLAAPIPQPGGPVARWQQVGCRFGTTRRGFGGVSLDLWPGQRIGLTGPNGCGKSSLLAVAAGLRRPDSGRCYLGKKLLYTDSRTDLDHGAALLAPQFPEYFFTRTRVADEVALDPALVRLGLAEILAWAGLPPAASVRNPYELSSGQRRRLAVALVLLSGRPLLLLDEPTACLDQAGRVKLRELMAAVPPNATLVVASHDTEFLVNGGFTVLELSPDGLAPVPSDPR